MSSIHQDVELTSSSQGFIGDVRARIAIRLKVSSRRAMFPVAVLDGHLLDRCILRNHRNGIRVAIVFDMSSLLLPKGLIVLIANGSHLIK